MAAPMVRIGVSGWRYAPWRGNFYPADLPQAAELAYAAHKFASIELNGSFYSLQSPGSWQSWHDATPDNFVFAVKGPRYVTHMLRLKDVERPLANFFASGVFKLGRKLGPLLWQLPPNFGFDEDRLEQFLQLLPRDLAQAAELARRRDPFMRGRCALRVATNRALRHALEVRHPSFCQPSFARLLRRHGVALVISESAGLWPMLQDITADFLYLRLHGDKQLYRSGYSAKALERWSQRITTWLGGGQPVDIGKADAQTGRWRRPRAVYCYFDNTDDKLRAPMDAANLMRKLDVRWRPASDPNKSGSRFRRIITREGSSVRHQHFAVRSPA